MDGDIVHRQAHREPPAIPPQGLPGGLPGDDPLLAWARARGGRVLVVDDSPTNRMVAGALLSKSGFSVVTACDGLEALAAMADAAEPFDAVLMDVAMPDMDGLAATRAIRALAGWRATVPVIAVTAYGMPEDRARCLDAGMDEVVVKPVRRGDLLAALHRWLETVRTTSPAP